MRTCARFAYPTRRTLARVLTARGRESIAWDRELPLVTLFQGDRLVLEGGQFIFRNLRVSLVSSLLTWTVEGEVINRTSKHWATARFIFFVYDGGTKITEADFELRDFEKGASRKLELPSDLLAVEPSTAVRYEIHFAFGEPAPELSPSSCRNPVASSNRLRWLTSR